MRRQRFMSMGEIMVDYLRETGLEKPLLERKVVELWSEVMGTTVARLTRSVEVEQGVLRVRLSSAALRSQLFEMRFELVKKMNEAVGDDVIRDVRLL
ncbi:MAG: DUF721 domain-containing protein [Paludibacteraceae bacterium]|nr:DUF721 domain-containing protein [Paludibacteraceae bacterium]